MTAASAASVKSKMARSPGETWGFCPWETLMKPKANSNWGVALADVQPTCLVPCDSVDNECSHPAPRLSLVHII